MASNRKLSNIEGAAHEALSKGKSFKGNIPLERFFNRAKLYGKAHPLTTIGTGLNAAGNVSGLFDNDKLLGQVGGTALGALAPKLLPMLGIAAPTSKLALANLAMAGGNLGALFDNLRAKKEQEQSTAQQYNQY